MNPRRPVVRRGLYGYERALARRGLEPVVGTDEAGRGACAGPLVTAAVVLGRPVEGLADSKLLTEAAREEVYARIVASARAWSVIVIPPQDIDRRGLHVCNVAGLRRAVAALGISPGYVLVDGFPVAGLPAPSLAIWKGDAVAACVAAASVVAKVTRDRLMCGLDARFPEYGFAEHKGYTTPGHRMALGQHGPCPDHRFSFVNVARSKEGQEIGENGLRTPREPTGDRDDVRGRR